MAPLPRPALRLLSNIRLRHLAGVGVLAVTLTNSSGSAQLQSTWEFVGQGVANPNPTYDGSRLLYLEAGYKQVMLSDVRGNMIYGMSWDQARPDVSGIRLRDGRVLVVGGGPQADLFDPPPLGWSITSTSAGVLGRWRQRPLLVQLRDERVMAIGGDAGGATAEIYEPEANSWTATAPLSAGHFEGATVQGLGDGRVLVIGGESSGSGSVAEIYDPAADVWSPAAPMGGPTGITRSARLADGRVLVLAAADPVDRNPVSAVYDPLTNQWTPTLGGLGMNLGETHIALEANGQVLAVGSPEEYGSPYHAESRAFAYVAESNAWIPIEAPPFPSSQPGVAALVPLGFGQTLAISRSGEKAIFTVPPSTFVGGAPAADAGPDQTVSAPAGCGSCRVPVTLDGRGSTSTDVYGDLDYFWDTPVGGSGSRSAKETFYLPIGVHEVFLVVRDFSGRLSAPDSAIITVVEGGGGLAEQIAQCQAQVTTLTSDVAALQSQLAATQGINTQLNAQVAALQGEIQSLNGTIAGLSAQIAALQSNLAEAAATIAGLNTQVANLAAQNASLTAQVASFQDLTNQLTAPGPQVAAAIIAIDALIPAAPNNTARKGLLSARDSLAAAAISIAAIDLPRGLNQISSAVSQLSSASLATLNTASISEGLSLAIRMRLQRTLDDVTALTGSNNADVTEAAESLAAGDAAHATGDYVTAIEHYVSAFKQLAQT